MVRALDIMIDQGQLTPDRITFELLAPRRPRDKLETEHIPLRTVGILSGHSWEQLELPLYTRDGFLINLGNTGPMYKSNQLVTIHDAGTRTMPEAYNRKFRIWYGILLATLGKHARQIATVSDFSRGELVDKFAIPAEIITVIHNSGEHIIAAAPDDSILERSGIHKENYLLAVSSLNPRKNFPAIIRAIEKLGQIDFDVVVAGGINPRVFRRQNISFPDRFRCLKYVKDGELRALYENAAALVYPSLYEGFGMPPLEAMTCGCPVLVSDIPPHREVCDDAALYCDPRNIDDIAEKIHRIMNDGDGRRRLIERGHKRAARFTWEQSAATLYHIVERAVGPALS